MSRRLVDFDPASGIAHYSEWGELDDALRYTAVQETDGILELNALQASNASARFGDGLTPVARIPMVLWTLLKSLGIIDDRKALERWLRDPDHRKYLVRSGKII